MKQTKFKQTEIGMIPEDWEIKTLGELVTFQRGHDLPLDDFKEGIFPVIKSNGLAGYHSEFKAKGPGVLLGRSGKIGEPIFIDKDYWPHNTTLFSKEFHNSHPKFVYYFLKTLNLENYNAGSAVPTLNRNHIHPRIIAVPLLEEQTAISKILSDLDSKIELNQQMNKTLEAIGQALFKHWFVDFEFPDENGRSYKSSGGRMVDSEMGMIPKGWTIKPIDEIAEFLNGLALQKYPAESERESLPVIKIRELKQGITDSTDKAGTNIPPEYIITEGDILFSWSGSLEVVIWTHGKGALNQHLFKVSSKNYPKWFYYYWLLKHLPYYKQIAEGKATTMGHIQRHHLKSSLVLLPSQTTLDSMNKIMTPVIDKVTLINIESMRLSEIRDSLLPKLMSGQIRVGLSSEGGL